MISHLHLFQVFSIHDLTSDKDEIILQVDVSDDSSVQSGFEAFQSNFDQLDIMVNSAGITGPTNVKTEYVTAEDFDRTFASKYSELDLEKTKVFFPGGDGGVCA